ncbi:hypothetical protein GH714_042956 [Hevea brasiliensis]|uniref:Scaffold protein Nfu/NifU N-terminal domain-containing protein n=1 Tax=Hevea brasiliensis TaxID=3981 RepID=A0A6A6K006_HEVBR|nr:hypothetical protein GH714_042956 [Hevea brasiliensis]
MFIQIESTPNPDALRFLLSTEIGTIGSGIEFSDANAAQGSTLARLLFEIQGVSKVFFGGDFVSVTKLPHVDWDALRPEILVVMTDYFSLHNAYSDSVPQAHEENDEQEFFDAKDSEVVQRVKELIEHYVRPAVAQDGGDIKFRGGQGRRERLAHTESLIMPHLNKELCIIRTVTRRHKAEEMYNRCVRVWHRTERFVIKGGDDTAFLLGKGLALDTARGQLLSSALGRMSMSDVHRLKREVVDSEGIASPVRAMFSRQIPDGDTLLAGEMAGVDDGLVIQELSRPEELEKLQHELAKQVRMKERLRLKARRASEELRTQLERLESDLGLLEVKKLKEVKLEKKLDAEGLKAAVEKLREVGKELEEKKLEELKDKVKGTELENHLDKTWVLRRMGEAGKELAAIRELRRELAELGVLSAEFKEWEKLEKEGKEPELVQKLKVLGTDIMGALEVKKLEELKEAKSAVVTKIGKLGGAFEKIEEKKPAELEKTWLFKKLGKLEELKKLGGTVEELAAIRELKTNPERAELRLGALSLEEQLRTLAEVKEVKALAEKQKAGGLEIQEGLQLTERMGKLNGRLVRLAAQKLEEIKELRARNKQSMRPETNPQSIRKAASMLEEISVLRELRQLDELIPEEQLRTLAEVKGTIAQLEAQKLTMEHKKKELIKEMKELVGKREAQPLQGQAELKGKEIARLDRELAKIKALEELTEIAEKRGVATTLKAALANAMETTKNRGWTDYLNGIDSSKRVNAVRELIAAEKIRAWARDINNLDVDERVCTLPMTTIPDVLMVSPATESSVAS